MDLHLKNIEDVRKVEADGICLSIYIPTSPYSSSQAIDSDRIRLKNAIQSFDWDNPDFAKQFAKTKQSLEKLTEEIEFWSRQEKSLAVFASSDGFNTYKLPYEMSQLNIMADHFLRAPIELMHSIRFSYFVIDISLSGPKVYLGSSYGIRPAEELELPGSMEEELGLDELERQQQFHTGAPTGQAMFHGHGAEADRRQQDVEQYLKIVAGVMDVYLADFDLPLILAGTDNRIGEFRKYLKYKRILDATLPSTADLSEPELHDKATDIMTAAIRKHQKHLIDRYKKIEGSGPTVSGDKAVAEAAEAGRIELLYVPCLRKTRDSVRDGDFREIIMDITPAGALSLEHIVSQTISHGGSVLAVNKKSFPTQDTKAVCRY
jgi:hypothetical protein